MRCSFPLFLIYVFVAASLSAQEYITPAQYGIDFEVKSATSARLPFFDDFSNYQGVPKPSNWQSDQAFVNADYAPFPPTVGVVTLDAVDKFGQLYLKDASSRFSGDTLLSVDIRLDSVFSAYPRIMNPGDSVYLSFYYLPGGGVGEMWERNGDAPEYADSLILDFFNPVDSSWNMVWCTPGWSPDQLVDSLIDSLHYSYGSLWQYVAIKITDPDYFKSNFKFRFRNYCSFDDNPKPGMVGNCDQWNIDYVYLNYGRSYNDRNVRDVAFVSKAPSFLKEYCAMPARQYSDDEVAESCELIMSNRYSQELAVNYYYSVTNQYNSEVCGYDGGFQNIRSFGNAGFYHNVPAHSTPDISCMFPVNPTSRNVFTITHVLREGVSGDAHEVNDTIRFSQVFDNYYAYDDGIAENGYGLSSTGSRVSLAYRFQLNVPDTLTSVEICFNRTRLAENENIQFNLIVWDDDNGEPGDIIYRDAAKRKPVFNGLNEFCRYVLDTPVVVSGTVYVGFEQMSGNFINIGFDRSNDSRQNLFYRTGHEWMQSVLSGSLMLRPYFGVKGSLDAPSIQVVDDISVTPNPASDHIYVTSSSSHDISVQIYDLMGKLLLVSQSTGHIDISSLQPGMYIVAVLNHSSKYRSIHKLTKYR